MADKKPSRPPQSDFSGMEERSALQNDLVQMVVHDLKAPLMEISANIDLLVKSGDISERDRGFAVIAYEGSLRLHRMITDMLDMGKMESGALNLDKTLFDMGEIAEKEIRAFSETSREKNVRINLIRDGDFEVMADEKIIGRVISNFVSNGLKFSAPGANLAVMVKQDDNFVKMIFKDTGPGVPSEYGEMIFDKYVQAEMRTHRRMGGTGLGLPFCKIAVEEHGGRVGLNIVERGSEFYFVIPKNG
ncbi:MAG: hypothetical protein IEMM0002_1342 [bacterium]|nr:MAG: hypothetical protein IEMM0002_1342 [bacterium]